MKQFEDTTGRVWRMSVTVNTIKRVRDLVGIDLAEADEAVFTRVLGDPLELVNLLFVLCQPQAAEDGVTDEQFGESMSGETIDAAVDAFLEELVGFFPQPRRGLMAKALKRSQELIEKGTGLIDARMQDPRIEERMSQEMDKAWDDELAALGS
ncbi:MAG: hypothetical protein AAGI68_14250 [Planctomycetota bacterium]